MPSRLWTVVIVLFWAASTAWMFCREVLPRFGTGEPPPFHLDYSDEVSDRVIKWQVLSGKDPVPVGSAVTTWALVRAQPTEDEAIPVPADRSRRLYWLRNEFDFSHAPGRPGAAKTLPELEPLETFATTYLVDREGRILGLQVKLHVRLGPVQFRGTLAGAIEGGVLRAKVLLDDAAPEGHVVFELDPVELPAEAARVNGLHSIHKITGLYEGRRWRVIPPEHLVTEALKGLPKSLPVPVDLFTGLLPEAKTNALIAEVHADALDWDGVTVPCWRIDYSAPGKAPGARTWVRRSDGLLLQQEAVRENKRLVLKRDLKG